MGIARNCLGSSVPYYRAQQQNFWAAQEAWGLMPKALPLHNLVKMAKFDYLLTKIAKFFVFFSEFSPTKGFVPDLVGLLERFSSIPTGRVQFYKILTVKVGKFEIRAVYCIIFVVFAFNFFNNWFEHPLGIFSS